MVYLIFFLEISMQFIILNVALGQKGSSKSSPSTVLNRTQNNSVFQANDNLFVPLAEPIAKDYTFYLCIYLIQQVV